MGRLSANYIMLEGFKEVMIVVFIIIPHLVSSFLSRAIPPHYLSLSVILSVTLI